MFDRPAEHIVVERDRSQNTVQTWQQPYRHDDGEIIDYSDGTLDATAIDKVHISDCL